VLVEAAFETLAHDDTCLLETNPEGGQCDCGLGDTVLALVQAGWRPPVEGDVIERIVTAIRALIFERSQLVELDAEDLAYDVANTLADAGLLRNPKDRPPVDRDVIEQAGEVMCRSCVCFNYDRDVSGGCTGCTAAAQALADAGLLRNPKAETRCSHCGDTGVCPTCRGGSTGEQDCSTCQSSHVCPYCPKVEVNKPMYARNDPALKGFEPEMQALRDAAALGLDKAEARCSRCDDRGVCPVCRGANTDEAGMQCLTCHGTHDCPFCD
jgi:hypothetical protein